MGFHDQMIDGAPWRSFTLARGDLRITTADRQIEREALNLSVLLAASVPVGVALLGCLCLLWLGIGQGLAPLNRMRDALTRRNADSLEPLQIHPLPSELRPLLETQNQLLLRIGKTIERERRLTGDAAHELRSPLTAIKTHLQVARMTDGAARDQSLARAEEGADRLHRTLEQLLRLAIQDANGGAPQRIKLRVSPELTDAPVQMPAVLSIAALRNLLENALRHTPDDTDVELNLEMVGQRVRFQVRDHGPGIAADDIQHLTQRFWRNGQSNGCGLGLAIVQAIVQRCGCGLQFDSRPDGLRVELTVPVRAGYSP
jgi:signal transduction histidine kinase